MSFQPGTQLGPYRIVSQLGSGGMGVVSDAVTSGSKAEDWLGLAGHRRRLSRSVWLRVCAERLSRISKLLDERAEGDGLRIRQQGVEQTCFLDRAIFEDGGLVHNARASSGSWATRMRVRSKAAHSSCICVCSRILIVRSRPENGSSSNSTLGLTARARARATRCCCPPDNDSGRRRARSPIPQASSASVARRPRSSEADLIRKAQAPHSGEPTDWARAQDPERPLPCHADAAERAPVLARMRGVLQSTPLPRLARQGLSRFVGP